MSVAKLTTEDLGDIVEVHLESFKGFFLAFLGPRFLRLYYREVIGSQDGVCCGYRENDRVKGFVVGMFNPSGFYGRILKGKWWQFGLAALPAILKKPSTLVRVLRAVKKPGSTPADQNLVELASVAILPAYQEKGVGKLLVTAFIQEATARGASAVYLTTDAENNERVNAFYKKMGFGIANTFVTPEKRKMYTLILNLVGKNLPASGNLGSVNKR